MSWARAGALRRLRIVRQLTCRAGVAVLALVARAKHKLSGLARDAYGGYLPLPQAVSKPVNYDEEEEDDDAAVVAADGKGSINDGTKLIPVVQAVKKKKASHASFGRISALLIPETPLMVMALLMLVVAAVSVLGERAPRTRPTRSALTHRLQWCRSSLARLSAPSRAATTTC